MFVVKILYFILYIIICVYYNIKMRLISKDWDWVLGFYADAVSLINFKNFSHMYVCMKVASQHLSWPGKEMLL